MVLPLIAPGGAPAVDTHPDLVEWVNLSPQPASRDIMNDEIPHIQVLGDDLVFAWETDYTHWPNPDGTQPVEYPEDEDIQVRFMRNGTLSPVFNVSTEGVRPEGYGHRSGMTVFKEKLYVYWNSHAWSDNEVFAVVLRVYDPAKDEWDTPRTISDTPDGGISAGASAAVHQGRLWFAWQGRVPHDPNATEPDPYIEIFGRWFDGDEWGPAFRLSEGIPGADTEPTLVSSGGVLHVAWSHDDAVMPGNADIHSRHLLASGEWSELIEEGGGGAERNDKKIKLVDWKGSPSLVWQSDGISLQGQVYSDVMLSVYEDGTWGPPRVVNPAGRFTGNVGPSGISFRDSLYIAWSSADDGITLGTDLDVVVREFDGERFGDIVVLSPDDTEVDRNPSEEGSVELAIYQGNLYAVFDAIFSPVTDGANKDILLRYVGYDIDGDGHDDQEDAFPTYEGEWSDADGDGVGDNTDAYPNDPRRWKQDDGGSGETGIPWVYLSLLAVLVVGVVILKFVLFGRPAEGGRIPPPKP
jgi:hypothetical protein